MVNAPGGIRVVLGETGEKYSLKIYWERASRRFFVSQISRLLWKIWWMLLDFLEGDREKKINHQKILENTLSKFFEVLHLSSFRIVFGRECSWLWVIAPWGHRDFDYILGAMGTERTLKVDKTSGKLLLQFF